MGGVTNIKIMYKQLFLLLAVFTVSNAFSQSAFTVSNAFQSACFRLYQPSKEALLLDKNNNGLNLNGGIKSVLLTSYNVVNKFGEISKGKKKCEQVIYFNQNGNISQREILLPSRNSIANKPYVVKYKYYPDGFLKSVIEYNSDGSPIRRTIFDKIFYYEFEGELYSENLLRENYPDTFDEYVNLGILTKKIAFKQMIFPRSPFYEVTIRIYDREGRIIQSINELKKLNETTKKLNETTKTNYAYDNLGRLTKESSDDWTNTSYFYHSDDSKYWNNAISDQAHYGKKRLRREYTFYNDLKKDVFVNNVVEYSYDYDAMGNWIRRTTIWQPKGETKSITERTITYY